MESTGNWGQKKTEDHPENFVGTNLPIVEPSVNHEAMKKQQPPQFVLWAPKDSARKQCSI